MKTALQVQNERLILPVAEAIYWEAFHKLDGMHELTGEEAGMIATKIQRLAEREIRKLFDAEPQS